MFALNDILESCDQLFDLPIRVSPDFLVFKEARNFIIFFKWVATHIEQVLSVMNMSFLKLFISLLSLCVIFLLIIVVAGTFEFSFEIIISFTMLFLLDELVVQILQPLDVSNDSALVLLLTSLPEWIVIDLQYFKVVAQFV